MHSCRAFFLRMVFKLAAYAQATICFFTILSTVNVSPEQVNFYEEYLGTVD